jgi:hypothetical protein
MRRWLLLSGLYFAAALAYVIDVDQTGGDAQSGFFVFAWLAASLIFGWGTGRSGLNGVWAWVAFPLLVIPIAVLFRDPDPGAMADSPTALYVFFPALMSEILVLVSAGARNLYEFAQRRRSRACHQARVDEG